MTSGPPSLLAEFGHYCPSVSNQRRDPMEYGLAKFHEIFVETGQLCRQPATDDYEKRIATFIYSIFQPPSKGDCEPFQLRYVLVQ